MEVWASLVAVTVRPTVWKQELVAVIRRLNAQLTQVNLFIGHFKKKIKMCK